MVKAGRESLKLGRGGVEGFEVKGGSGAKSCMGRRWGDEKKAFLFFHLLGQRTPHYVISFREEDGTKSIC